MTARGLVGRMAVGGAIVVATLAAALAAIAAAAQAVPRPVVYLGVGWLVLVAGITLGILVLTWRTSLGDGERIAAVLAAVLVASLVAGAAVLTPLRDTGVGPTPVPGTERVRLATGSEIAFVRETAAMAGSEPIVFLHGGPGFADMAGDLAFVRRLARDRHDIVLYDQAGAGHSARLADPTTYTLERDVADLAALLDHLEIDRPILVGHSYGGTLAAAFAARNPDAVARLIFLAPGEIGTQRVDFATGIAGRLPVGPRLGLYGQLLQPRALVAWLLSQVDLRAAHAFAGDRELDAHYDRVHEAALDALYCEPPANPTVTPGIGFYTNMAGRDVPDLRADLARVTAPAIILKPQCDYLPWQFGVDLATALPNATLVYIRGAGHSLYVERSDEVVAELHAFLDGAPLPIAPQATFDRPPDLRGP